MFVGPYEHHSNELPWREFIAEVVVTGEDPGATSTWPTWAAGWPGTRAGRC